MCIRDRSKNNKTVIGHIAHRKQATALVISLQAAGSERVQELMLASSLSRCMSGESLMINNALEQLKSPQSGPKQRYLPLDVVRDTVAQMARHSRRELRLPQISLDDAYANTRPLLSGLFDLMADGQPILTAEQNRVFALRGAEHAKEIFLKRTTALATNILDGLEGIPGFDVQAQADLHDQVLQAHMQAGVQPNLDAITAGREFSDMDKETFIQKGWKLVSRVQFVRSSFPETEQEFENNVRGAFIGLVAIRNCGLSPEEVQDFLGGEITDGDALWVMGNNGSKADKNLNMTGNMMGSLGKGIAQMAQLFDV
eukprot:TRINITY_DN22367_c0_g1_i1.p1 TRINITY_DN22367_c0_g1~~TRINITY_DN22367_c0_g1_i1.p1  ORF type:complete len:313 (+),score=60.95 TRINITY_DN22367_c0_g1_i1:155-1093(+)